MSAKLIIIGVDGLDYDVVRSIGRDELPTLAPVVQQSSPHSSVHPPDSVPSWTTIFSGIEPEQHGQLKNANFLLDGDGARTDASLRGLERECFWTAMRSDNVAIINPFLAYPPWGPGLTGGGIMVSGPPFAEEEPSIADRDGLAVGVPPRMGGFTRVPSSREIDAFALQTLDVGQDQYDYTLAQLNNRNWDLLFFTTLIVDRLQHYGWRYFDRSDPTYPGPSRSWIVRAALRQLDEFLSAVLQSCSNDSRVVVLSDHGHGQRASIGVSVNEVLRRSRLLHIPAKSAKGVALEIAKVAAIHAASRAGVENLLVQAGRRVPNRRALKEGTSAGKLSGVYVSDLGGSNPFGGITVDDPEDITRAIDLLENLRYRDRPVFKWIKPVDEVLRTGRNWMDAYPAILFEMYPKFGPAGNLFGPLFSPIVTHKRQSGGHTQRGVFAVVGGHLAAPHSSGDVHRELRKIVSDVAGLRGAVATKP